MGIIFYDIIDETMIFNRALTQEEIAWIYNKGKPVGQWKFDEGEGTTAKDSSENNKPGTISGGAGWTTSGKFNSALDFAGDNDYVDIGGTGFTAIKAVSLWVKPDSVGVTEYPLDLNGAAYVKITNGVVTAPGFTDSTIYINGVSGASAVTTDWNHILIKTGTGISASDMDIGRLEGSAYFAGLIDEVKIYNYEPTAEQVKLDYNQGAAIRFGD